MTIEPTPPTTPPFRQRRTPRTGRQAEILAAVEKSGDRARAGKSDYPETAASTHALEASQSKFTTGAAETLRIKKRPTPRKISNRKDDVSPVVGKLASETMRLGNSIEDCAARTGFCRSVIYADISAGRLRARKRGHRTIILEDDLLDYLRNLPDFHDAKSAVPGQRSKA